MVWLFLMFLVFVAVIADAFVVCFVDSLKVVAMIVFAVVVVDVSFVVDAVVVDNRSEMQTAYWPRRSKMLLLFFVLPVTYPYN